MKEFINYCLCGCGEKVKIGNRFILGHSRRGQPPWNKGRKTYHEEKLLTNTCLCGCGEKVLRRYVLGHHMRRKNWKEGPPLCECGCNNQVNSIGNRFIRGHSNKMAYVRHALSLGVQRYYNNGGNASLSHSKAYFVEELGHKVRSLWEENICKILKHLDFDYTYEPKRFKLSNGRSYLPDMYIPCLDLYIGVKGRWRSKKEDLTKPNCFINDKLGNMIIIEQSLYKVLFDTFKDDLGLQYRRDRKAMKAKLCMTEF